MTTGEYHPIKTTSLNHPAILEFGWCGGGSYPASDSDSSDEGSDDDDKHGSNGEPPAIGKYGANGTWYLIAEDD